MAALQIQLNTVDAIDMTGVSGKELLRRVVNVLIGQLGGAAPRSSSVTISAGPNDQSIMRPLLYPMLMPVAGTNVDIYTNSGFKAQNVDGDGNDTLNEFRAAIDAEGGEAGTISQLYKLTNRIAVFEFTDVLNVGDQINLFGTIFTAVPHTSPQTPYTFSVSEGISDFLRAVNQNPATRDRFVGVDSQGFFSGYILIWIGGPDSECPKWQYSEQTLNGDRAFSVIGWSDDVNVATPMPEGSDNLLCAITSKIGLVSPANFENIETNGFLQFLDNPGYMVQGIGVVYNTFPVIEKIQL